MRVEVRTFADGLLGNANRYGARPPIHVGDPSRGDQDAPPSRPLIGIDDQVANDPRMVVDDEIIHLSDLAVARLDPISGNFTH
jgi:hypothetical protein